MDEDVQPGAALAAAVGRLDRADPEGAIADAARRCSNLHRWGPDDVLGTLNYLDAAKRAEGAALVRRGASFSLAQSFDEHGPQKGWRRRTNPVHTMLSSGLDAEFGLAEFPHGLGGADDVVFMPLQASTQWDGLGHIFDHGQAYNGRRAFQVVTSDGDQVTGIETAARAASPDGGAPLDAGRAIGTGGELPDGFAITKGHLKATIAAQGDSAGQPRRPGAGPHLPVTRARRDGWGDYACGASRAVVHHRLLVARQPDRRHRHRHWGFEVRPNEFDVAFQPLHQVAIPHIGLFIGEMWGLDALAADCAADGVYDFLLVAAPLPVTGAVGAPVNPIAIK